MIDMDDPKFQAALRAAVTQGIVDGFRQVMNEPETLERFWSKGYEHLSERAQDEVSRSIGKRVLTWTAGILMGLTIWVAMKAGIFK